MRNLKFTEGKGGSFFCFAPDKSFILKTVEKNEAKLLNRLLPHFYAYFKTNPNTFINKLYGLHAIKIQNLEIFVVVMGNLFNTPIKIHEKYDLKFSWVNRSVKEHHADSSVLGKDMDLERKLNVGPEKKLEIEKQLESDVEFLSSLGIMDYSLLLGFHFKDNASQSVSLRDLKIKVDLSSQELSDRDASFLQYKGIASEENKALENKGIPSADGNDIYFLGLIDILQTFNFSKKSERCFKIYFMRADKVGLSVQPVDVYKERFIRGVRELLV